MDSSTAPPRAAGEVPRYVRDHLPTGGLFAEHQWKLASRPFPLSAELADQLEKLGRVLLQFYRASNLLYRQSSEGKQPAWVAQWLDQGKPDWLIEIQRDPGFKSDLPRVIRPDILLNDRGFAITELDSVPGGIGLTAWLNLTYSAALTEHLSDGTAGVIGGERGMLDGFAGIFPDASHVHILVSDESSTYRPEMEWLSRQLDSKRFHVQDQNFTSVQEGEALYRFFELFDTANIRAGHRFFQLAQEKKIQLTPPPKAFLEEKLLFALLWNKNLEPFWRKELGQAFYDLMRQHVPYSWIVDPSPLPPHAAFPDINLTDWHQLKSLSKKDRNLILKASGFSPLAWGSRSVSLGSDLSLPDWSAAVDEALRSFATSPFLLQRYEKPAAIPFEWYDPDQDAILPMQGRVRLCPYYFVHGNGDNARAQLGGVLATVCPADKKIIHGMTDAVLAPCSSP